jgi:hypothetical protein
MITTPKEHREPITDLLVLSALDRGERHRTKEAPGVPIWTILDHLDTAKGTKRAREIRTVLEELVSSGAARHARRRSTTFWVLTPKGAGRLRGARRAGKAPVLPESPQHRLWREAQAIAEEEMDALRQSLTERLDHGLQLLGEPGAEVCSDAWFVLGDELERAAWIFGSASYCLREWAEPDESRPDRDSRCDPGDEHLTSPERQRLELLRTGRRDLQLRHGLLQAQQEQSPGRSA